MRLAALLGVTLCFLPPEMATASAALRPFAMGFTPFPYDMTPEAVRSTSEFLRRNGDMVAHHFDNGVPWTEALAGKRFHAAITKDWEERRASARGKAVFLALTPLDSARRSLALYRSARENMPLPDRFRKAQFNDPAVKKAYLQYCRRAIEFFKPRWCAIGIEVNELLLNAPSRWPDFLELYKETYSALKKQFPQLPLCATLSLHSLTDPAKSGKNDQRRQVLAFLELNDLVALSYYPFMAGNLTNFEAPLAWVRKATCRPLAVAESGFPAETIRLESFNLTLPSTPARQKAFLKTLLKRALVNRYRFVVWFLHRDYDALWNKIKNSCPEAFVVWKDCGLIDELGRPRPALKVWRSYLKRKWKEVAP